ncbi:GNAT family N-acetyltransferase [Terrarubrum flagellatum]|uniref:GNAT family N-acetyltransferase n=1 Tax=Terrirubrum flagellatum TaxID=2895980 RepID=UPI0031451DDA
MITSRIVAGVGALSEAEWSACYPDEVEGWAYYRACEAKPPAAVKISAVEVRDEQGLLAAAPLFKLGYRLDTPLQGGLRRLTDALAARAPNLLEWGLLGVGSPFADRCHIALRPGLGDEAQRAVISALADAIEQESKRLGVSLIAFKDIAGAEHAALAEGLRAKGYGGIDGLPVAALDLNGAKDIDFYLATLSGATRKDVRRKLRGARLRVERRTGIADIAGEIDRLYQHTRTTSALRYGDFEELPDDYFAAVSGALGERALFMLYWVDDVIAGFNLLLLERDRAIDKFFGMTHPLGREHNLYVASWIENVRFCIETGRRWLQSGQTAYDSKVRLGSALKPSWNLVKHRNRIVNGAIALAAPYAGFPRWDPDLRRLKAAGKI